MLTFRQMDPVVEQARKLEALAFVLHESLIASTEDDYHAQVAGMLFYLSHDLHTELGRLLDDTKTRHDPGNAQGANKTS
jgi:hypothetical protein